VADRDVQAESWTPAQWYCVVFGATLVLAGVLGFFTNSSFGVGDSLNTEDQLIVFEVNGWHNVIHLLSGIFLLAVSRVNATARLGAIGFGVVYGAVTLIGLIDGQDVFGLIPVNAPDNVLHLAIALLGILTGLMSKRSGVLGSGQSDPSTV
jgi:hypothetical protein